MISFLVINSIYKTFQQLIGQTFLQLFKKMNLKENLFLNVLDTFLYLESV